MIQKLVGFVFLSLMCFSVTDVRLSNWSYAQDFPLLNTLVKASNDGNGLQIKAYDQPGMAFAHDFEMTKDPATGKPEKQRLIPVLESLVAQNQRSFKIPGDSSAPWVERGPSNVGGRSRCVVFDPNDPTKKKVWAGGVGGGLWYNLDITSANSPWHHILEVWDNMAISCIAFDPNNPQIFYVGTGEGWGNGDGQRGLGIWKTWDGGTSWTLLTSTSDFYWVNDIVVRNENGQSVVYAALGSYFLNTMGAKEGIYRSLNGGLSWQYTFRSNNHHEVTDLSLDQNNKLWAATYSGKILKSNYGIQDWNVLYDSNLSSYRDRSVVVSAPTDANYVYALFTQTNSIKQMKVSKDGGSTWTDMSLPNDADNNIPANDFTRYQASYNLTLAVDPYNKNRVIVGGINLFLSNDAGATWTQISKWSQSPNQHTLSCSMVHADQHFIAFRPGYSSKVVFANDGGIYYTDSLNWASTHDVIKARNTQFNITQAYTCAMHPQQEKNVFLMGTQDNGTHMFTAGGINTGNEITGGDGAYCFIDTTEPNIVITSNQWVNYNISIDSGASFQPLYNVFFPYIGRFINPTAYDHVNNMLIASNYQNHLLRIHNVGGAHTATYDTIPGLTTTPTFLKVSPYTTQTTTLFVGTEDGKVYKVMDAGGEIISQQLPAGLPNGYISCIEIGQSEQELIVTLSNYGVNSVWYTSNGGQTWISKEGALPDMPVRWALFNPSNPNEVLLPTELGVWATNNFKDLLPVWVPSNNGLANTRVDMLQYRSSDKEVLAATHGRGLFSSSAFSPSFSVKEEVRISYVEVYPNPTQSFITISSRSKAITGFWLYSMNGVLIIEQKWDKENSKKVDVSGLASGAYLAYIMLDGGLTQIETLIIR